MTKINRATEVSLEELASITGRTKAWLNKLAADGYFRSERHGTYRIGDVIAGLLKHAKEDKRAAQQTPAMAKFNEARTELVRLRTAKEANVLISHQLHLEIVDLISGTTVAMLNGLPSRLFMALPAPARVSGTKDEFERVIHEERQRLAQRWERDAAKADGLQRDEQEDEEDEE